MTEADAVASAADEAALAVAVEVVEASAADAEVTEAAVEVVEASVVEEVVDVEESALAQKSLLSPTFVSLAFTFNAEKTMSY